MPSNHFHYEGYLFSFFSFDSVRKICLFLIPSINFIDAIVFKFKFLWLDVYSQATGNLVFFSIFLRNYPLSLPYFFSASSILILILPFNVVFYCSFFYVNSKYILLAFLFLLLSCRENHFIINGSQICFNNNKNNKLTSAYIKCKPGHF